APVNAELQARVLEEGGEVISCRPADLIKSEMKTLVAEVQTKAKEEGVTLADNVEEDALINGLFVQVGWKFIANRGNPDAFEPAPNPEAFAAANAPKVEVESYTVNVNGQSFDVAVGPGGSDLAISAPAQPTKEAPAASGAEVDSPLAGNILKINTSVGAAVAEGDVVVIMEAMKMETEVRSKVAGTVSAISVKEGDSVAVGDVLISL
ncbi:MAG: oxaloacetate decarboxylase, partial [Gammaproteobacteria bacterium]